MTTAQRTTAVLFLALMITAVTTAAPPRVKGEKVYLAFDKIVLTAEDVGKAQILWDVTGDAQVEEVDNKLYVWARPGRYSVQMTAIDFDSKKISRARLTFTVLGDTPPPPPVPPEPIPVPPTPVPPTPPVPPQPPAPIPTDGFRVLIVEDKAKRNELPQDQLDILFDESVDKYLNEKCPLGVDGKTREWRIWDKSTNAERAPKLWQDALKRVISSAKSYPWIIISNGKTGYEGPLPKNVDETIVLLKKYAEK